MLTLEQFKTMAVGDEPRPEGALLAGLTAEPVVLHTLSRTEDTISFRVTYFGVTLGNWIATLKDGALSWQTA